MPIRVDCPKCHKTIRAGDDWAGRAAKCPGCGASVMVPRPEPARATNDGDSAAIDDEVEAWAAENRRDVDPSLLAAVNRLPPEPQREMQEVPFASTDPKGPQRVVISEIRLTFSNAVWLVLQFWVATFVAWIIVVGISLVVLAVLGVGLGSVSSDGASQPRENASALRDEPVEATKNTQSQGAVPVAEAQKVAPREAAFRQAMKEFVRGRIRTPSTAKFAPDDEWQSWRISDGHYRFESWVDFQNVFGAMVRYPFVGEVKGDGADAWSLAALHIYDDDE